MVSRRTVILDCGASRTALGVFRGKHGRLHLEEFAHETEAFQPGGDATWLERTRAALGVLRSRLKSRGPVVVVFPAHLTLTKMVRLPRVDLAQRERIIRFEAEQNIPSALADVVWDSLVVGETENEMEVLIVAAKLETVEPLCVAVEEAGFEARLILPSSLATLAGFRLAGSTAIECSLVLAGDGRWQTLLQVGPKEFAVRIFSLGSSDAADPSPTGPVDASPVEALPARAARLAQEVERSLRYFRTQGKTGIPVRLWLDGKVARQPRLAETILARLKLPVEPFEARSMIDYANEAVRQETAQSADSLVELIGGAVTQLQPGTLGLNLLPPSRLGRANCRRRQPWLVGAAALFLASLLLPSWHFQRLAAEAQRKTAALERRLAPLRACDRRIQDQLQHLAALRRQLARLESLSDRRVRWLGLLAGLQEQLGGIEDVWLEKMQVVPAAGGQPLRLAISGRLLDKAHPLAKASPEAFTRVKNLLSRLAGSPLLAAVEDERFDNSQPGLLRFDCVLVARPEQPL